MPEAAFCTGTIIAPRVVLTAKHCTQNEGVQNAGFSVGDFFSPATSFDLLEFHEHPQVDTALLILEQDATQQLPGLEILPPNREDLRGWEGREVQAGGYGDTWLPGVEPGLWFVDAFISQLFADSIWVESPARAGDPAGVCFGDSGSSVLGQQGSRVVALGNLSGGDEQCAGGGDAFVRLDPIIAWIDGIIAETGGEPPPPPDCQGLDERGRCDGSLLRWCEEGRPVSADCAEQGSGMECVEIPGVGVGCSACGDLNFLGRCAGSVAEWCEQGEIQRADCANEGLSCGYVDDEIGWFCMEVAPSDECEGVPALGACRGDELLNCVEGQLQVEDCNLSGRRCQMMEGEAVCLRDEPQADFGRPDPRDSASIPQPPQDAGASGVDLSSIPPFPQPDVGPGVDVGPSPVLGDKDAGTEGDGGALDGAGSLGCQQGHRGSQALPLLLLPLLLLNRRGSNS